MLSAFSLKSTQQTESCFASSVELQANVLLTNERGDALDDTALIARFWLERQNEVFHTAVVSTASMSGHPECFAMEFVPSIKTELHAIGVHFTCMHHMLTLKCQSRDT